MGNLRNIAVSSDRDQSNVHSHVIFMSQYGTFNENKLGEKKQKL